MQLRLQCQLSLGGSEKGHSLPFAVEAVNGPWQKFEAALSNVAATSIFGSQHVLTDLQPLAEKVAAVSRH